MAELDDILVRRDIQRYLTRKVEIVWAPLWLTGGSSSDGQIVFLDNSLRNRPKLAARVIYHERFEAAVRHILGKRYPEAHRLATEAERRKYGPEPRELRAIVNYNIKEKSRHVPRGFDRQLAKQAESSLGSA
jgi:hypothetical protein